jgi:LacI family transcriptional regulator
MAHVTIRDVAALAEVSPATVSRVLNADPRVAPELHDRVIRAAETLGYRPNSQARSLRTQATKVLGLIISDIQNPFFTALVRGVEDAASERDYSVVLANADEDLAKERRYLEVTAAERMAGVILSPASTKDTRLNLLTDHGIPVVVIDRRIRSAEVDSVTVNNQKAAKDAVAHLISVGCRRIGVISGPPEVSTASDRLAGYRAALRAAGLPLLPELVVRGDFRIEGGRRAAGELLALDVPPDGLAPPITLIEQPTYEIGRRAADLLLRRIAGETFPPQRIVLPAALRVRKSSQRAPAEGVSTRNRIVAG